MSKKGFTLVELLATIVIIAFIMGIVLPSASRVSKENKGKVCTAYENMMEEYAMTSAYKNQYFIELSDLEELEKVKNDCAGYVTVDYSVTPPKYKAHISCNNGCKTDDYVENIEEKKIRVEVPKCKTNVIYNGQVQSLVDGGVGYLLSNEKRINVGKQNVIANIADKRAYAWKDDATQTEKVIRGCEMKKRPITLKAKDITFTYQDATVPKFDYTLSNTISGEDPLTSSVTYKVKDSSGNYVNITNTSPAGTYTIIPSATVSSNYSLTTSNGTLTIKRKPIAFPTCGSFTYNGSDQTLFAAHTTGEYTNLVLKGKDAGNYTVNLTPTANYEWSSGSNVTSNRTLTCTIGKKALSLNTPSCSNKTYNGNTSASCTITYSGIASGDSITGGATCIFDNKNVGTNKTVTCKDFTKSGTGNGNYTVPTGSKTTTASITAKQVTASISSCESKTYDKSKNATCVIALSGLIDDDTSTGGATCTFDNENVGTGKTITCQSFTSSNTNYKVSTTSATKTASITAKALTANTPSCSNKTYNGNTSASCTITYSGVVSGESITGGATCTFDDKNVGTGKTVTCKDFTKSGTGNGNYTVPTGSKTTTASITAKALTTNTPSCSNKTYNGNTSASCTITYSGVVSGDSITGGATCTFDDKNVGTGKTVTCTSFTKSGTGNGNYTVPTGSKTTTASITAKALTTNTPSCSNKTYNGNTSASCTITYSGVVSGDSITGGATCTFDNKNVGTGKTVTCTSFTKSGTGNGNYTVPTGSKTTTASITAKALTANTPSCSNKTYNGNTSASCTITYSGVVSGESITGGATCTFDNKNVGTGKIVTCKDFTKSGTGNGNYTVPTGSKTTTADITAKALTANTPSCSNKTYNGNTSASCTITYSGVISGESITGGATCTFDNANVGTNKTVTCTNFTKSGTGNANYTVPTGSKTTTASITALKCNTPTNVAIASNGKVTWTASSNCSSSQHQVKVANGSYANATSGVDKNSDITAATGSRTVYVKAVAPNSNYTDSDDASASTTVYSVSLTKGTGISSVSGAGNYISGSTAAISATPLSGYNFTNWVYTSSGNQLTTSSSYSASISSNWNYTANAKSASAFITYDYQDNLAYVNNRILNTGYTIDWGNDFKIEEQVLIYYDSQVYVAIGNYGNGGKAYLSILFDKARLRLMIHSDSTYANASTGVNKMSDKKFPLSNAASTLYPISIVFTWTAATQTYHLTATSTTVSETYTGAYAISGTSTNPLRVNRDYRTSNEVQYISGSANGNIETKYLRIIDKQQGGSYVKNLPASKNGFEYQGWFTAPTGGTNIGDTTLVNGDATYYQHHKVQWQWYLNCNCNDGTLRTFWNPTKFDTNTEAATSCTNAEYSYKWSNCSNSCSGNSGLKSISSCLYTW